jgi:Interferon-induced transmembrane protein
MADDPGPPRPKYPPPKPPSPTTGYQPGPSPPQPSPPPPQPQPDPRHRPDGVRPPAQPPARWALSIISCICFLLIGLIALYFSAQVGTRWRTGNTTGAEKASQAALLWGIAGILVGLFVIFAAASSGGGTY